jgi:hypothetical protein
MIEFIISVSRCFSDYFSYYSSKFLLNKLFQFGIIFNSLLSFAIDQNSHFLEYFQQWSCLCIILFHSCWDNLFCIILSDDKFMAAVIAYSLFLWQKWIHWISISKSLIRYYLWMLQMLNPVPQFTQVLLPINFYKRMSSLRVMFKTPWIGNNWTYLSSWPFVLGKPSRITPFADSGYLTFSLIILTTI